MTVAEGVLYRIINNKYSVEIRGHYGNAAYQVFKALLYDGGDPMEFRDYLIKM